MKKLSEINEGMFSGMVRRSNSEQVKKEDAYNPEYIDFGEDTTVYWAKYSLELDGKKKFAWYDIHDYQNNGWRLPTIDEVKQLDWNHKRIHWSSDGGLHISLEGKHLIIGDDVSNGFHLWTSTEDERFETCAYAYGYNNSYKFDCDSTGKFNRSYVFLVKDKKVNEGMFSGMIRRANTDQVKKEDNVNQLNKEDFCKYLKNHYEITCKDFEIYETQKYYTMIPYERNREVDYYFIGIMLVYSDDITSIEKILFGKTPLKEQSDLYNILNHNYNLVEHGGDLCIEGYDIFNSDVIDIIDIIINTLGDKAIIKKKL